jgi:hypothetical protein
VEQKRAPNVKYTLISAEAWRRLGFVVKWDTIKKTLS